MRYILLLIFALITTFASAQVQYLGSPTTTVRNRGNFVSDSLFYLPKRSKTPSDTAAIRYQISDSTVYVWTGGSWRSLGRAGASFLAISDTSSMLANYIRHAGNGLTKSGQALAVDTFTIATRNRAQKQVDSLGGIMVNTTTGQNISGNKIFANDITFNAQVITKLLTLPNKDGLNGYSYIRSKSTGVNLRDIYFPNDSGTVVLDKTIGSYISSNISGTTNYVPKFTASSTIGNSQIFDNGTNVGIGTASPSYKLHISGNTYVNAGTNLDLLIRDNGSILHMEAVNDAATSNIPFRIYGAPINLMGGAVKVNTTGTFNDAVYKLVVNTGTNRNIGIGSQSGEISIESFNDALSASAGLRIYGAPTQFLGGEVLVNTSVDAGAYAFQVSGAIYNTAAAVLAASGFNDVRIGSTSGRQISGIAGGMLQVWDNPGNYGGITIHGQNANNAFGNYLQFIKSRGTGNTVVQNGDDLGGLYFAGADGTNYIRAASMRALIDATPGTNDMPTALVFETTADGGTVPSERMRITSAGNVGIGTTAPERLLHVNGTNGRIRVTGGNHGFEFDDGRTGFFSGGADIIHIYTGGGIRGIFQSNELILNTTTDAGAYALQVSGSIYNTGAVDLAATSGSLRIGTTTTNQIFGTSPILQVAGDAGFATFQRFQNNTFGSVVGFTKSRNTTIGSHTIVQSGDDLGRVGYFGSDGSAFQPAAAIDGAVDGTPGANDMPGRLTFFTSADGTTTLTERMRITSTGNVGIGTTSPSQPLHVNGNILTAAPSGGTAKPFKIGAAATVSPTSPNRTIEIEIDGVTYYLHAKTTNN